MQFRAARLLGAARDACRQYHQLEGREAELRRFIETEYQAALQRHAGRAVDERAETHLQVAALALASHKALLPFLRDEGEVLQVGWVGGWVAGRSAARAQVPAILPAAGLHAACCLLPAAAAPNAAAATHSRSEPPILSPPPPSPLAPTSPQIIREHMGGRTASLLRFLLAATKLLHRDGYAALTARLSGLQSDMGAGFASQLQLGGSEVRRCCWR